jgi:ribosomal-protein-serine acetyltransferase
MKASDQPIIISVDEKLELREITLSDATAIFKTIDRNRNYLRTWLPFVDYTRSVADTESYILSVSASVNFSEMVFVVLYQLQHIGIIGFKGIDPINLKLEIGYWLAEAQQGKGIMIHCCQAMINYAFESLEMNRIQLKVATGNYKSQKIPVKLGFTREGIERDGELSSTGQFHDLEVYSLLKREWKK